MVSRIMLLIGLISAAILDRSLFAEAAERVTNDDFMAEHRSAVESSVIRLPPDIVIPLPFVYPEYSDPREHVSTAAKIHQPSRESLGDAILENVRNTMLVSPSEETELTVKNHMTDRPISRKTNRHRSSLLHSEINDETPASPDENNVTSSEDGGERPSESPSKFGTRLRASHGNSNNQELVQTVSRTNDYNEYNDSHEHVSSAAKIQKTSKESLGDAILENVRNTMLETSSGETEVPVKNGVTDKPTVRKTNRHRSSLVRSEINDETPARLDGKNCASSEDGGERGSESPSKFGTRIRASHGNSNRQELVRTRSRSNDGVEVDGSIRNGSEVMSQSTCGSPGRSTGRARGEISMRRNPEASIRHTVPRRRRPNVDSSGDDKSEADVTEPRSLAGRIFRRKTQPKSRGVENDRE